MCFIILFILIIENVNIQYIYLIKYFILYIYYYFCYYYNYHYNNLLSLSASDGSFIKYDGTFIAYTVYVPYSFLCHCLVFMMSNQQIMIHKPTGLRHTSVQLRLSEGVRSVYVFVYMLTQCREY